MGGKIPDNSIDNSTPMNDLATAYRRSERVVILALRLWARHSARHFANEQQQKKGPVDHDYYGCNPDHSNQPYLFYGRHGDANRFVQIANQPTHQLRRHNTRPNSQSEGQHHDMKRDDGDHASLRLST